ncbi:hypothetical protein PoB_005813100 [Plakobranchus ocellatus]|uniref:Uncharacterized protein n=1 Tax=Plakobranchus ocellatus TaxID=259542 RepID=A0AAV4CFR3_9GAST|nr:hypothetical protein PoB_005813100 [Plakobranchus ocellatus]
MSEACAIQTCVRVLKAKRKYPYDEMSNSFLDNWHCISCEGKGRAQGKVERQGHLCANLVKHNSDHIPVIQDLMVSEINQNH